MPIEGSKDTDYSLVSTTTWVKNWLLRLGPRARWSRPKWPKSTPLPH